MKMYAVATQRFNNKEVVDMNLFVQACREEIKMLRAFSQTTTQFFADEAPRESIEALDMFINETVKPIGESIDAMYRKSLGE